MYRSRRKPALSFSSMISGGPLVTGIPKAAPRKITAPEPKTVAAEKPAEEKPAEQAAEKPAEEKAAEDKPAEETPAKEQPVEDKSAEDKPSETAKPKKKRIHKSKYIFTDLEGGWVEGINKFTGETITFKDNRSKTDANGEKKTKKVIRLVIKSPSKPESASGESPLKSSSDNAPPESDKKEESKPGGEKPTEKKDEATPAASEEKEEEVKMPGQWKSDDWTAEQDATITKMKGENRSWKDIAIEVGASKKDCTNRWKELQKEAEEAAEKKKEKEGEKDGEETVGEDGGLGELGGLFDDTDVGGVEEEQKEPEPEPEPKNQDQKGGNHQNQKQSKKSKKHQQQQQQSKDNKGDSSGENIDTGRDGDGGNGSGLRADDIWTKNDCEVLEMLKERYEGHKWQHMQAGFFNWTGRMVVADLIEKKFRDDGFSL